MEETQASHIDQLEQRLKNLVHTQPGAWTMLARDWLRNTLRRSVRMTEESAEEEVLGRCWESAPVAGGAGCDSRCSTTGQFLRATAPQPARPDRHGCSSDCRHSRHECPGERCHGSAANAAMARTRRGLLRWAR